jgi:hypothetical protein
MILYGLFIISIALSNVLLNSAQSVIAGFDLKWKIGVNSVDFIYTSPISDSNNVYVAFAFSTDTQMGNDCVCVCKIHNNIPSVEHNYNTGKSSSLLDSRNPSVGISNQSVKIENGMITCSFTREKNLPNINNYFALTNDNYYILHANGRTNSNGMINN